MEKYLSMYKKFRAELERVANPYNEFYKYRKKPESGPESITVRGTRYNQQDFNKQFGPIINFLNNPTEGQSMQAPGGQVIEYKNGEWYAAGEKSNLATISEGIGIYNYVGQGGAEPTYNTDYYTE